MATSRVAREQRAAVARPWRVTDQRPLRDGPARGVTPLPACSTPWLAGT